jgi:hypothetical protein
MRMEYTGKERRNAVIPVCGLHKNIDGKLDRILERQEGHIADIQHIKDVVENGLKTAVINTNGNVAELRDRVTKIKESLSLLEEGFKTFSWFRTWVTELRDKLFKRVMQIAFVGAIVWFILNFGKQAIFKILS